MLLQAGLHRGAFPTAVCGLQLCLHAAQSSIVMGCIRLGCIRHFLGCKGLQPAAVGRKAVVAGVCNCVPLVSMVCSSPASLSNSLVTAWAFAAMQIRVGKAVGVAYARTVGEELVGATLRANSKFGCSGRAAFDFIAVR